MSKMTVMLGSPRENSISSDAAEKLIALATEKGYDVVEYNVNRMDFSGCTACGSCRANNIDCVVNDDFGEYLKDLRESDILLVTAPNYYAHIAGPMVSFMNRHYCLLDKNRTPRLENTIRVAGIFSQGAPAPREEYEAAYLWYMGIFEKFGMDSKGHITIGGNTSETELDAAISELADKLL